MNSNNSRSRLAGVIWFLSVVAGGFGYAYVRTAIVPGDAAATAGNIVASEFLFRAAIVSNLLAQTLLFFFSLMMYRLFKEADKSLARVFLASVMMTVGLSVINALNPLGALLVLSRADYLNVFTSEQLNTLAMIFLRQNSFGQGLLEIFWVPYFFSFGLLVVRYRFLPKVLGILLMAMSVGYAVNILDKFLFPQIYPVAFTRMAMALGALGGIPTILWLLIKGAKVQPLDERAS